jgi:predicted methyltransferase
MSRWFALSAVVLITGCQSTAPAGTISREHIAQIVASPDRSAADRTNDQRRKPELMLGFIGLRPGMVAMDISAGGGYTTELLARAIGPTGRVYGQVPRNAERVEARAKNPALSHIVPVVRSFDDPVPMEISANALDLVTLMFNYHDFGHLGVDRARLNRAVFAALKPGGGVRDSRPFGSSGDRHWRIGHVAPHRGVLPSRGSRGGRLQARRAGELPQKPR